MRFLLILLLLLPLSAIAEILDFSWSRPTQRENGAVLKVEELGGYEFVAYNASSKKVWSYVLNDGKALSYKADIPSVLGAVRYEIAVFDTNGLYSRFVEIKRRSKLLAPTDGEIF